MPKINPNAPEGQSITREARIHIGEETVSSISGSGEKISFLE